MRVIKAPEQYYPDGKIPSVFLAGSIDMGNAVFWQDKVVEALEDYDVEIFNPRRDDWDSTWEQNINNPKFNEQVTWELDHLGTCDIIAYYFDPNGQAPITLMELGLLAWSEPSAVVVCCPDGFWRKGNVDIICQRSNITQVENLDNLILKVKERIDAYNERNRRNFS